MRALLISVLASAGCYHYAFDQRPAPPNALLVTHVEHVPTWLNGLVGTGELDTARYCKHPVRTELQVRASDVLISIATLLIYTPHTLTVTCVAPGNVAEARGVR